MKLTESESQIFSFCQLWKVGKIMSEQKNSMATYYLKWAFVIALMFGFRYIPPIGGVTPYGMAVAGIMIGLIFAWAWDPKCMAWSSLLALVALGTTDYGNVMTVMVKTFGTANIVMIIVTSFIVGALIDAKIDLYLIRTVMGAKFAQGKPWMLTFLLIFGPFIISIFVMNVIVALFLIPIYGKIFKEAGYKAGDKYVINVYIGMFLSLICSSYTFPFLGSPMVYGPMVQGYMGTLYTNGQYLLTVTPFVILMCAGFVLYMRLLRCDASKIINLDMSVFGDNTQIEKHQKSVLNAMFAFIIGCLIITLFGNGSNIVAKILGAIGTYGWALIVAAAMMIIKVDGKRLLDIKTAPAAGVYWDTVLLVAAATCVASALTAEGTGIGALFSGIMAPILGGLSTYPFMIALVIITLVLTNIANNVAVRMIALTVCGAMIAGGMSLNAAPIGIMILLMSTIGIVLPSSSMFGAFLHTAEMVTPTAIYKNAIIALVYVVVCLCVIYVPLCMLVY